MKRFNTMLAAMFLSAAMLFTSTAQAMTIVEFDKMSDDDQAEYLGLLVEGAEKVLMEASQRSDALKVEKLFTEKLPGETVPVGSVELERNIARARVADLKRLEKDPKARRLEVEDAMIVTLRKNGIELPPSFRTVGKDFKPKHPPQGQKR